MCWQCRILKCFPPPFTALHQEMAAGHFPQWRGGVYLRCTSRIVVCVFKGATQRQQIRFALCVKKKQQKKTSIKLSSLSVRSLSLWRAKTRFAITAACIYSNLWLSLTGQIICRRWFCFSTKKEEQTNKQTKNFILQRAIRLECDSSGEAEEERQKMTTFGSNCSPCRPPPSSAPNIERSHFFFKISLSALRWKESVSRGTWATFQTNESQLQGSADVRLHFLFAASLAR